MPAPSALLRHASAGAAVLLTLGFLAAACSKPSSGDADKPTSTASAAPASAPASTAATASVSAAAAASAAPGAASTAGPTASIPAGKLIAGTACGDHPRAPGEELAGEAIEMGAFDIDVYPYPNDPSKPPLTSVSRDEAKKLCEARGRRLCGDLEWERACKGPSNTRYEYGDRFDAKVCPTGLGPIPPFSGFERCASGFGAHAMHGFLWEWTANDWKRGKEEGKGVLRGGYGNQPYAHMRCSGVRSADPAGKEASVGFRCCGGAANTREVEIPADEEGTPVFAEEKAVDEALLARFKRALANAQVRDPDGVTSTFTKVWRWRAAPRDELILARYESKPAEGPALVQPLVIRLCDKTVQLISRLRAPVEEMDEPVVKDDAPGTAVIHVKAGANSGDVKLAYQFAQVGTDQPAWIKAGAAPAASGSAAASAAPSASPASTK